MADKVDYGSTKVEFSKIIYQLHEIATQNAGGEIDVDNTAFDENKFLGAGEYAIFFKSKKNENVDESERSNYLKYVQTYVKYFVGEDAAKLIKKNDLCPLVDFSQDKKENTEEPTPEEGGETPPAEGEPTPPEGTPSEPTAGPSTATSESQNIFMSFGDRKLMESLDMLFEADAPEGTPPEENPTGGSSTPETPEGENNDDDKKEDGVNKGFCIFYAIDIEGQKRRGLWNMTKRKAKGLFGGMWTDLMNIQIKTLGGGSIKIGRMFDFNAIKSAAGMPDINIATVDNNIQGIIHNDFPQSSAQVRVYDKTTLINLIRKQRKTSPEIESKINAANYSVTIMVEKRDGAYKEFTKEKVADICTRAFGTAANVTNFNKVTKDDVIQIGGWNSEQKVQSVYDVRRNNSSNAMSANSASAKESQVFILRGDIVESILNDLFGEVITEELITEGHANEYNLCKEKLQKIGIENLKANLPKFREEYSKAANKCQIRKTVKGKKGSETTIVTGVQVPTEFKGKTENSKAYEDLLKKSYMKGSSDDNPFMKMVVSKWTNCNTIDEAIKAFDSYITENGSRRVDYSNDRTIECWMALEALKTLPEKEEKPNKIKIRFVPHNPMEDKDDDEYAVEIESEPGKVNVEDNGNINGLKGLFDGDNFHFKNFEPDPNTLKEDGKVVVYYEKTNESDGQIEITFVKKDPSNPSAEEDEIKKLKAKPHEFDKIKDQYPTEDEVKYDNYKFTGWDPDPNEQDKDTRVSAKYEQEQNMISVCFTTKDPTGASSEELSVKTIEGIPHGFDENEYPKAEELKKYDKYKFTGWEPDPNSLDETGKVSAKYDVSDISVFFRAKDPTKQNSIEKTIFTQTITKEELGKIDIESANEKLPQHEGFELSAWNPDPNDYDISNLPTNKTIETNAVWKQQESDEISIKFMYKNPEKENALPTLLSTYVMTRDNFGKIPAEEIGNMIPKFDDFDFSMWDPDPNDYDNDSFPKEGVATVNAKFKKHGDGANEWDLFIIPHKRLTSQNRPNKEEKFDDGTVRSRASDAEYKPSDMRMP